MISSKEIILNSLAKYRGEEIPLPDLDVVKTFLDPNESLENKFGRILANVGGKAVQATSKTEIENHIIDQGAKSDLSNSLCLSTMVFGDKVKDHSKIDIPTLSKIEFGIIDAQFGVAENGAVWISEPKNVHRSVLFIVQHLVVILDKSKLVSNMHDAYKLLDKSGTFSQPSFGTFISGPSKTADIEQSLVIGAHGPRSHVVYLV